LGNMEFYETFLLGFAVLVVLAGIAFSIMAVVTPSLQSSRRSNSSVKSSDSAENTGRLNGS
jgi:hypothetical protein